MNDERFEKALSAVLCRESSTNNGIGTLSEKSMHAVLKHYFEPDTACHEVSVGGFVADIVGENGIIEIQTRSLYGMNKKLDAFLQCCNVTVVYPIVNTKKIIWTESQTGEVKITRVGGRKKNIFDALHEIYHVRKYIGNPRFSICLVLLEADDYRIQKNKSKSRRHCICDRVPTKIVDEIYLNSVSDYLMFLPNGLPSEFTTADVSKIGKMPLSSAQSLMYFLHEANLAQRIGKIKNSYVYKLSDGCENRA